MLEEEEEEEEIECCRCTLLQCTVIVGGRVGAGGEEQFYETGCHVDTGIRTQLFIFFSKNVHT